MLVLAFLLAVTAAAADAEPRRGWLRTQVPETDTYTMRYLPYGLDLSGPVPVVVFLHGSGSFPEQWQTLLAPEAEALGFVVVVPKAVHDLGFGVGADDVTVRRALEALAEELPVDPDRVSLAGHSAGGAYAQVLGYGGEGWAGLFSLSAPYRTVLRAEDPAGPAPIRLYYGTQDPNYQGGSYTAIKLQLERLGARVEEEVAPGHGHSGWPDGALTRGFSFLLAQRYAGGEEPGGLCEPSPSRLCLQGGRFAVEAAWTTAAGTTGPALLTELRTDDSGLFYFFREENWELQVKVLDGCAINGSYWVFAAGTTNVAFDLVVTDLETGLVRTYSNPQKTVAVTVADNGAFPVCG